MTGGEPVSCGSTSSIVAISRGFASAARTEPTCGSSHLRDPAWVRSRTPSGSPGLLTAAKASTSQAVRASIPITSPSGIHLALPADRDRVFLESASSDLVTIRVSSATDRTTTTIRVEGRLAGADLPDLRAVCESANAPWRLDLSGLRSADTDGIRHFGRCWSQERSCTVPTRTFANCCATPASVGMWSRPWAIAITDQSNRGPIIELSKDDWSQLIMGKKSFASLHASLEAFDGSIIR